MLPRAWAQVPDEEPQGPGVTTTTARLVLTRSQGLICANKKPVTCLAVLPLRMFLGLPWGSVTLTSQRPLARHLADHLSLVL